MRGKIGRDWKTPAKIIVFYEHKLLKLFHLSVTKKILYFYFIFNGEDNRDPTIIAAASWS